MSEKDQLEDKMIVRNMSWGAGLFAIMTACLIGLANVIA